MFAAPSGDKTPPQRNKTGAGGEDVSFEASNNQQGHACGVEPWRAARPLRASAALRSRRSAPKDAASPPRLGDLNELGSSSLVNGAEMSLKAIASAITSSIPEMRSGSTAAGGRNSCNARLAAACGSFAKVA